MDLDISLGQPSVTTGRWNFVRGTDGDVAFDSTEAHSVVTACLEQKNGYWFDSNYGSVLSQLKNLTSNTPSQSQAAVLDALQSLQNLGLIINVRVTTATGSSGIGGGALGVTVSWNTPTGNEPQSVSF